MGGEASASMAKNIAYQSGGVQRRLSASVAKSQLSAIMKNDLEGVQHRKAWHQRKRINQYGENGQLVSKRSASANIGNQPSSASGVT